MLKSFVTLFSQADVLFYIFLFLAISLFAISLFVKSAKVLRIAGLAMLFVTVAERCIMARNNSTNVVLYLFYIPIVVFLAYSLFKLIAGLIIRLRKKKMYIKVGDRNLAKLASGEPDYSFLIGKRGEVVSDLKSVGKVNIDGEIYEVTTLDNDYIYTGAKIVVFKIDGSRIIVKQVG